MTPIALVQINQRQQLASMSPVDAQQRLIEMWLHGKSKSTVAAYRYYITQFLGFLGKPLQQVTLEDLYAFAESLGELAPNTQKIYLACIKSVIAFAHKIGLMNFNVGAALKLGKTADRLSDRLLMQRDIQKMVWATEQATYRYQSKKQRDLLIIKLLYTTGLRVSELTQLSWSNLLARGDRGQLTIIGKGEKTRSVIIPCELWNELMAFKSDATDDSPVFKSRKGNGHLDRSQINRIIDAAALRAGINKKVSPHWLRHAHATHALEAGADIGLVQQTLGHANVATTSRYLNHRPDNSSSLYIPAV
ncbi:MAG: tyrosine-type recombinase/integrase [Iphinoe sp. HA4291-MV1]|jgi:integrase/recombinase XerD|nr:tyrosine-type recombinase/integrase [Iphinoe sp. HA4291-MV1]